MTMLRPTLRPVLREVVTPFTLAVRQLLGGTFSPSSLFAAGEQGAWYDPSDFSTLFQDSAGTTPVTAVEQPVGRMLDKSGRGNHAFQSTETPRPVLSARVNQYLSTETLATQNVTTVASTYTLRFEGAGTITLSGTKTGVYSAGTHTLTGVTAGTLTSTVSGTVSKADLRVANDGVGLPAYQRVNTSTDYDTTGFPLYLRFDGVDDFLVTNSINFTSTDKMTVWAEVRDFSTALCSMIELSAVSNSNNGSFVVYGRANVNGDFAFGANTGATYGYRYTGSPPSFPITRVVSNALFGNGNISTGILPRVNGVTPSLTNFGSIGTGSFGNYPIYIGRRGGTTLPFNGRLYQLIIRGAQSTAEQIAQTETYVNNLTKAYA